MAIFPKTPGVYVQEISTLPPSVAPISTAIPAFIGHTEKGPLNTPTRITSLLEYETTFGGAYAEPYSVNGTTLAVTGTLGNFSMYYNMQMFFANGGGPCYIASAGGYGSGPSSSAILTALATLDQIDEVTLLVVPEAIATGSEATIYDAMVKQCGKLQDRFSILDVKTTTSVTTDASYFRGLSIDLSLLNYGAAYYPVLKTILSRHYKDEEVLITAPAAYAAPNNRLYAVKAGVGASATFTIASLANNDSLTFTQSGVSVTLRAKTNPVAADEFKIGLTDAASAVNMAAAINAHPTLSTMVYALVLAAGIVTVISRTGGTAGAYTLSSVATSYGASSIAPGVNNTQDTTLYNNITAVLQGPAYKLSLYPSSTMAGIYSSVDNSRGVWKAPANVSLTYVDSLGIAINDEAQGPLNVDATSGKSINAIRKFNGKGILVWGARTLDGNSNEWRYINVRRLFIMAEEACRKASEFVVFEPNDKKHLEPCKRHDRQFPDFTLAGWCTHRRQTGAGLFCKGRSQ